MEEFKSIERTRWSHSGFPAFCSSRSWQDKRIGSRTDWSQSKSERVSMLSGCLDTKSEPVVMLYPIFLIGRKRFLVQTYRDNGYRQTLSWVANGLSTFQTRSNQDPRMVIHHSQTVHHPSDNIIIQPKMAFQGFILIYARSITASRSPGRCNNSQLHP